MKLNYDAVQQEGGYAEDREVDWGTIDLPAWMDCRINYETEKQAKSGGRYLQVAFKVTSGEAEGGTVWAQLTTSNKNAQAVEIGARQIGELLWACGLKKGADSQQLVGKKLQVRVVGEESERYGLSAKPVAFKPTAREPDSPYPESRGEGPSPAGFDPGVDGPPMDDSPPVEAYDDDPSIPF